MRYIKYMQRKIEKLSLGFVLVCLLIAPVYAVTLLGAVGSGLLFMLSGPGGAKEALVSGAWLLLAGAILTMLIAGLYRRNRWALGVFVLFFPTYVSFVLFGKQPSSAIVPIVVIYGLTLIVAGLYSRELKRN